MDDEKAFNYINTILKKGSISSAAQTLFISQPSLSQFISRLENAIGAKILDRTSKPVKLTQTGEIYYQSLTEIVNIKDKTLDVINELNDLNYGEVVVGALSYISQSVLAEVIMTYNKIYPNIKVNLINGSLLELEEYAASGIVDFSVLMFPYENPKLDFILLGDEPIVIASACNSTLAKRMNVSCSNGSLYPLIDLNELKNEQFIILTPEKRLRRSYEEVMEIIQTTPISYIETNDVVNSLILASCNEGVTLVPLSLAKQFANVLPIVFFTPVQRISKRRMIAAYNKTSIRSSASIEFLKYLKDYYDFEKSRRIN